MRHILRFVNSAFASLQFSPAIVAASEVGSGSRPGCSVPGRYAVPNTNLMREF
jgi:hypothetical protein